MKVSASALLNYSAKYPRLAGYTSSQGRGDSLRLTDQSCRATGPLVPGAGADFRTIGRKAFQTGNMLFPIGRPPFCRESGRSAHGRVYRTY
jgi:hypothetical protein